MVGAGVDAHGREGGGYGGFLFLLLLEFRCCGFGGIEFFFGSRAGAGGGLPFWC